MAVPTWFSLADERALRGVFEERLPSGWVYHSCGRAGGTLHWRRQFSRGFIVEMVLSSMSPQGAGYRFRTTLILSNDELPELEKSAKFEECMPSGSRISGPRNNHIVATLYVEALPKLLQGSALWWAHWTPHGGIDQSGRWLELVDEALRLFQIEPDEIMELPSTILELGALGERPSPNPVTVWQNAFVGAAEVAMLLGQPERAAEIIESGRARDWSVSGTKVRDPMLLGFARCEADKLAAMGYRWPPTGGSG
ncbi:MAG: hypothetical protein ACTHL8_11775 [Burkholderiaceae bacterium]